MNNKASRVLIVDDMAVNRMILSSLLSSNGVLSDQVESGAECLLMCEKKDYDLILLDHRMPDLDGVDTLLQLKELFKKKNREVPVICHTTAEGKNNINLYKAAGFSDVLIKPVDPALMSRMLMTYLKEDDKLASREDDLLLEESKIIPEGEDKSLDDELLKLPLWLKSVPHIDLVAGVKNCGSAEDYVDALYVFYSSIEDKAKALSDAVSLDDFTTYTLLVHSLKSYASLIGARTVFELAKELEAAGKEGNYSFVRSDHKKLMEAYRSFEKPLSPLKDLDEIMKKEEKTEAAPEIAPEYEDTCMTILFIHSDIGVVPVGIEKNLKEADFKVISVPDEPDDIVRNRFKADIILYLPCNDENSHMHLTMNLLGEICQDDSKLLCLMGDPLDIEAALETDGAFRVSRCYPRPVKIKEFISDMKRFSEAERAFHLRKTLHVVDDDPDYLAVISRWLSSDYNVSCYKDAPSLLEGIEKDRPDLILMDYEMPGMDGYELMQKLRKGDSTYDLPIIFLTRKNDREHVTKILSHKPDGYLLKSSRKEALLDAIKRFFSENLFRLSAQT